MSNGHTCYFTVKIKEAHFVAGTVILLIIFLTFLSMPMMFDVGRLLSTLLLAVVAGNSEAVANGTYTVIAPKVIRPNLDYHVSVSTYGIHVPVTVTVQVGGKQNSGGTILNSQTTVVESASTQMLKFQIGELGEGQYNLTVRGSGGMRFQNTTELEYVHKSYSVFIQTDKAIYKPGNKVQFRVIVVNPQLKPSVTGALDIYMTDGKKNRVKQWNRVFTTQGVFTGALQLSEQPVLGDWNITVDVLGQMFSKTFEVAEYVLPKFEVTVDLPPYATFKDSKVVATIRAQYTFGKPVKGEATVSVYPVYKSYYIQPAFQDPVRKVVHLNGKKNVEFDIAKEIGIQDDFDREFKFDVVVKEDLTGRRQNNSAVITLYKYKYKMELIKTSDNFKPGLKYTAYLKVAYQDDTPVQDDTNYVTVKHAYSYNHEEYNETKYKIPKNGIIELNFNPPDQDDIYVLRIEGYYLELSEWFSSINRALSPSNSFIQIFLKTENPKVYEDVMIEVNSTTPLKYFVYEVLGRGDLVFARTIQAADRKSHLFQFVATTSMAPRARVIVYYVREDGEVVADALDFEVEGTFQNFIDIKVNTTEAEPGDKVKISIEAKPNSFVGLLGIDQSVLLLKSGNDITQGDVIEELHTYDSGREPDYYPWFRAIERRRRKRSLFWWPGSATAKEVFQDSGVVILTNAFVYEHHPFAYPPGLRPTPVIAVSRPVNRPVPPPGAVVLHPDKGPAVEYKPVTRPPLAGPYAFSRIPRPVDNNHKVFLLRDLPPTWVFANVSAGYSGKTSLIEKAPDTITSWVITGFSLDTLNGLGITESPTKLKVFRPFFVMLNLPYSVIRGETVAIQMVVFNYMKKDTTAEVTLESAGDFEFTSFQNEVSDTPRLQLFKKKSVIIKAGDGTSVSFMITPTELGYIDIKVTARAPQAQDVVIKKLLVKAEGEPQYRNKAILVDLRDKDSFSTRVKIEIPKNSVPESEFVQVSAIADIMGPSVNNLDNLLRMPYGCGEQNMINFVPNIVVTEYLKKTNQLTESIRTKAGKFMETGYQRELTYRRDDGSFSAFGNSDASGSTWLTAFVARSFHKAIPHIVIDESVIQDALQWIVNNQREDGSFPEVGKVSHKAMQGGAAKGLALTAYVLISLLESRDSKVESRFINNINRAIDYIARELDGVDDTYTIAILSYTLQLADHPLKETAFNMLESKAIIKEDYKYWGMAVPEDDKENPLQYLPKSTDVEMTAYALLTYLKKGLLADTLPIMKWLVAQRNENGGFASTQDTVIGIYALSQLVEQISGGRTDMEVKFTYPEGTNTMKLDRENAMVLSKYELPPNTKEVNISAEGIGFAIVQVSYVYNLNVTGAWPSFTLDPQVDKNANENHLQVTICSGYTGEDDSNMAVMEVALPSGYTMDVDALPSLKNYRDVKRVEMKEGDTSVIMYFDKMTRKEVCPTVSAYRTHKVANQKPVPVVVYDYYDSARRARVFYEPVKATLCDICEGEDCDSQCRRSSGAAGSIGGDGNKSTAILPTFLCLLLSATLGALVIMNAIVMK